MIRMLGVFDLADWSERELGLAILCSIVPVTTGTVAVWYSVRNLSSALRGDNVPVIRPIVTVEEFDRLNQRANQWLMVAWAGGLMFVFTAGIDGSVPQFGLLGILIFVGVAGFLLVTILLVPLSLFAKLTAKRWSVARYPSPTSLARPAQSGAWPVDMRSRHCWDLCVLRRMASRGPPSLGAVPGLELGHGFHVALSARNPGFRGVRAAVVFSAVALIEAHRIARNAKAISDEHA